MAAWRRGVPVQGGARGSPARSPVEGRLTTVTTRADLFIIIFDKYDLFLVGDIHKTYDDDPGVVETLESLLSACMQPAKSIP